MARPTLNGSAKFKLLTRSLDLPRPFVRGLLETLWDVAHETGEPLLGDPSLVEAAAEWPGSPGDLFAALRDCRFLDETPEGWAIHDYWDHAPDYAKDRRKRELERRARGVTLSDLRAEAGRLGGLAKAGKRVANAGNLLANPGKRVANGRTPAPAPREDLASPPTVPSDEGTSGREALVGPPAGGRDPSPRRRALLAEVEWRLQQVWATHLLARERFYESENGTAPPGTPGLTKEIRKAIRDAIKEHDGHRLREEDRAAWRKESPVRAAGIGIFMSPFHTGKSEKSEGTRYLEPWRPWKRQRGKPDPVEMFAQFFFENRTRRAR